MSSTACSPEGNVVHADLAEETFGLARSEILAREGWSAHPLVHNGALRTELSSEEVLARFLCTIPYPDGVPKEQHHYRRPK